MPLIEESSNLKVNAIVYATDLSIWSQNAGLYAVRLAKHFSAKLLVAHAFTLAQAAMEVEVDLALPSRQRKDLNALLSARASLLSTGSVRADSVLIEGDPKEAIPDLADKHSPALLVLGTHGGGRIERAIIGSVAEAILRSTHWPALTVGPQVRAPSVDPAPFRRILYATDFTPGAARAAVYAISLAEAFRSDLDVLNVIEEGAVNHPDRFSEVQRRFYDALDDLVPQHAREFCHPRTFVEAGQARERILEHIRERSVDLLVLGIRKSSHLGLQSRMSGAFQLIVDAECPVLTITG